MSAQHIKNAEILGLTLDGYLQLGMQYAMKGVCILCGAPPTQAGVCVADGTEEARKKMGTPEGEFNHRLAFFALCDCCAAEQHCDREGVGKRIEERVLAAVKTLDKPNIEDKTYVL